MIVHKINAYYQNSLHPQSLIMEAHIMALGTKAKEKIQRRRWEHIE